MRSGRAGDLMHHTCEAALALPADMPRHQLLRHSVAKVMCQHMHGRHIQVLQQALCHISVRVYAVRGGTESPRLVAEPKACKHSLSSNPPSSSYFGRSEHLPFR